VLSVNVLFLSETGSSNCKRSCFGMKVSNVVKTAVKLAPIVIPIVKKVMAAKKGTTPNTTTRKK